MLLRFEGSRRTYASLWQLMQQQLQQSGSAAAAANPARHLQALPTVPTRSFCKLSSISSYERGGSSSISLHADAAGSSSRALRADAAGAALPRINVLGSGRLSGLAVPRELRPHVSVYRGMGYADYYDTLCRSVALLPLFNNSSGYLTDKISSTVLASVATTAPMVVPPRFLEVYSIFKREHVLVMDPASNEVAAMMTLSTPAAAATLATKRASLQRLRRVLNQQASAKLDGLLGAAIGRPHATTKQD
eukprot:GHUV01019871.1.p1 GENE.GHUV01019871.1~~GHUV01019871.1.p1  ORF type:complete len:248 (+),score=89.59 GHUV01019871.1:1370-2113(+)